jgi:hypothetical protein
MSSSLFRKEEKQAVTSQYNKKSSDSSSLGSEAPIEGVFSF